MINELDTKMVKRAGIVQKCAGFAQSWSEPQQAMSRPSSSSLFYNEHSKAVAISSCTSLVATSTTVGSYSEETVSEPIDNEEFQKQFKLVNECLDANKSTTEPKPPKLPFSYMKKCDCEKQIQAMTTSFQEKITLLTQHIDRSYNDYNRLVTSSLEFDKMISKKMAEIDRDAKQRLTALEEENKAIKRENQDIKRKSQAFEEKLSQLDRHVQHLQEVLGIQKALETLSLGEGSGRSKKTKK